VSSVPARRRFAAISAAVLALGGCRPAPPEPAPPVSAAEEVRVEGWLHVVWGGDGPHLFLTGDAGTTYPLHAEDAVLGAAGGVAALDRRRVAVTGRFAPGGETLEALVVRILDPAPHDR
jgi:hypothetical protein